MDKQELFIYFSKLLSRHGYDWQIRKNGLFKVKNETEKIQICNFIVIPQKIELGSRKNERYIGGFVLNAVDSDIFDFYEKENDYYKGNWLDRYLEESDDDIRIYHGKRSDVISYLKNILTAALPELEEKVLALRTREWDIYVDEDGNYSFDFGFDIDGEKAEGYLLNKFLYGLTENYKFIFSYMLYCKVNSIVTLMSKEVGKNLNIVVDFDNPKFNNLFDLIKMLLRCFNFDNEPIILDLEYNSELIGEIYDEDYDWIICFAERINENSKKDIYSVLTKMLKTNVCKYRYISISDSYKDDDTFININMTPKDYDVVFSYETNDYVTYYGIEKHEVFYGMNDEEVTKIKNLNLDFFNNFFNKNDYTYSNKSKVFIEKIVNRCDKSRLKDKDYLLYAHIDLIIGSYLDYIREECQTHFPTGFEFTECEDEFYDILEARMYKPINENIVKVNMFLKQIRDYCLRDDTFGIKDLTDENKYSTDKFTCDRFARKKIGIVRNNRTKHNVDFLKNIQTEAVKKIFELEDERVQEKKISDPVNIRAFFLDIEMLNTYIESLEIE